MDITGIICEYNPLHLGHMKQIHYLKEKNSAIVCLMSGNFVQRGHPAIFDKMVRAEAAVRCGADLVLELPVTAALSSAEGFAGKGAQILSPFCDKLCFGAENANEELLMNIAKALLSEEFKTNLRRKLDDGSSFPVARQAALESMGIHADILEKPNNILAVEYCKAILSQGSRMQPWPILRNGNYHDQQADMDNPSATSIRNLIFEKADWHECIPEAARSCFSSATIHAMPFGENAVLARLRTMADEDFKSLPYGSEGLWRKLMHASRTEPTLEDILCATKSKRYTRTRLDRMVMCGFLGITEKMLDEPVPYTRVLAFSESGREIIKEARKHGTFINAGEVRSEAFQKLEDRCGDLYGLFAPAPEAPGRTGNERIYFNK